MNNKSRILISGAAGFIGTHLLDHLLKESYQILCLDLFFSETFIQKYGESAELLTGNVLDKNFLEPIIKHFSPDYVFHFAGSKNRSNLISEFTSSFELNYFGTLNLFSSLLTISNLKLVTIMGTSEEYGLVSAPFAEYSYEFPGTAYGLSKLAATKLALIFNRQFNLPVVIFRPSIAYGPMQGEDMFLTSLIKTLLRREPFKMTKGEQLRDFVYIDDLIEAFLLAMKNREVAGQLINIGYGSSVRLSEIALQIAELTDSKEYLRIGDLPYRCTEIMNYTVDISKAYSILKWYPKTKLEVGLEKTISFFRENLYNEA
jgi:UDP-glucose 4-epimerase